MNTATIRFNGIPQVGDSFSIGDTIRPTVPLVEEYVANTDGFTVGEVEFINDLSTAMFRTFQALLNHYNNTNLYNIQLITITGGQVVNEIRITGNLLQSEFSVIENSTGGRLTITVDNGQSEPPIEITGTSVGLPSAGDVCTRFGFGITTNVVPDRIEVNGQNLVPNPTGVTTNLDLDRADTVSVVVFQQVNASGFSFGITERFRMPVLREDGFSVNIVNTPSGATVSVFRVFPFTDAGNDPLRLAFSYRLVGGVLTDTNFFGNTSWSGVPVGNYVLTVRDSLGCQIDIDVEVTEFEANLVDFDPIAEISAINSLAFKLNQVIDGQTIFRNQDNTLSYEDDTAVNDRGFFQVFQKQDVITTQVKSNYANNEAVLIDCDGNETSLTVTKKSNNMNLTDLRDGRITILPNNQIGVYFGTGRTFDPVTMEETGTYNLGESLMTWVNIGDYLNIEGMGFVLITDIISPTDDFNFTVAAVALNNTGINFTEGQVKKITTVYNSVDFERFEFLLDSENLEGDYCVRVRCTDTNASFQDVEFLSERIRIVEKINYRHHTIRAYNSRLNEINWFTGIISTARVRLVLKPTFSPEGEQEIFITDTSTVLIEGELRKGFSHVFAPTPYLMALKICLLLKQDRLNIDGINYVCQQTPSPERVGNTNTYIVRADLVRADYKFESVFGSSVAVLPEVNAGQETIISSIDGTPLSIGDSNDNGLLLI